VRAIIFDRDRIMVAEGCELRERVSRSDVRSNTFAGEFIPVAAGVRGSSACREVQV
jgi:hypothetical protein